MEHKTYTIAELAGLIGVTSKDIDNTKRSRTLKPVPGSGVDKVRAYMREHGIEWSQVVSKPKGRPNGSRKSDPAPASPPTPEAKVMEAITPPDAPELTSAPSSEHEMALAALFADGWVPEEAPAASNYARDFPLSHIPLETLVTEITRRMPRAEVVLR